jgi:hypothetical protein
MKTKLIITAAMIAAFFAVLWQMPEPAPVEPDPRVQALQAEVSQLRARMDDVENVQGYIVWQKDWRNSREPQADN